MDASGLVLCPGFIDSHSHDDQLVLEQRAPHPKLAQGVCTVVTGNCGISLAPLVAQRPPAPLDILGPHAFRFACFRDYLDAIRDARPCVNVAPLIGHTSIRVKHVSDLERSATAPEITAMRAEVGAALRGRDALLAMHIRDEGDHVDAALKEALEVGARCQARLVLSHHKVVGVRNHGRSVQTLGIIDQAALSQPVCMDCYRYEASSTMLHAEKAAAVGNVLISWSQAHPQAAGRTLQSLAQSWGLGLLETARRLMPGGAIYFSMAEADVDRVLQHPLTMIGSDGLPHDALPHPRM